MAVDHLHNVLEVHLLQAADFSFQKLNQAFFLTLLFFIDDLDCKFVAFFVFYQKNLSKLPSPQFAFVFVLA